MSLVDSSQWDAYRSVMRDAHDTFMQQDITWTRVTRGVSLTGREDDNTEEAIALKGLFQYNYFHSWPITYTTTPGEIDRENTVLWLNLEYLGELDYLDTDGNFDFDPALDRFTLDGVVHKCMGWTPISQAQSDAVFVMLILKREELSTDGN